MPIPEPDGSAEPPANNHSAICGKRDAANRADVARQSRERSPGCDIPESHHAVLATTGDCPPIGSDSHPIHTTDVALEDGDQPSFGRIPNADRPIVAPAGEQTPVCRQSDAIDRDASAV